MVKLDKAQHEMGRTEYWESWSLGTIAKGDESRRGSADTCLLYQPYGTASTLLCLFGRSFNGHINF